MSTGPPSSTLLRTKLLSDSHAISFVPPVGDCGEHTPNDFHSHVFPSLNKEGKRANYPRFRFSTRKMQQPIRFPKNTRPTIIDAKDNRLPTGMIGRMESTTYSNVI